MEAAQGHEVTAVDGQLCPICCDEYTTELGGVCFRCMDIVDEKRPPTRTIHEGEQGEGLAGCKFKKLFDGEKSVCRRAILPSPSLQLSCHPGREEAGRRERNATSSGEL